MFYLQINNKTYTCVYKIYFSLFSFKFGLYRNKTRFINTRPSDRISVIMPARIIKQTVLPFNPFLCLFKPDTTQMGFVFLMVYQENILRRRKLDINKPDTSMSTIFIELLPIFHNCQTVTLHLFVQKIKYIKYKRINILFLCILYFVPICRYSINLS